MNNKNTTISQLNPVSYIIPVGIENTEDYVGMADLFNYKAFRDQLFLSENIKFYYKSSGKYDNIMDKLADRTQIELRGIKIDYEVEDTLKGLAFFNHYKPFINFAGKVINNVYLPYQKIRQDILRHKGKDPRNILCVFDDPNFEFVAGESSSMKIMVPPNSKFEIILTVSRIQNPHEPNL